MSNEHFGYPSTTRSLQFGSAVPERSRRALAAKSKGRASAQCRQLTMNKWRVRARKMCLELYTKVIQPM